MKTQFFIKRKSSQWIRIPCITQLLTDIKTGRDRRKEMQEEAGQIFVFNESHTHEKDFWTIKMFMKMAWLISDKRDCGLLPYSTDLLLHEVTLCFFSYMTRRVREKKVYITSSLIFSCRASFKFFLHYYYYDIRGCLEFLAGSFLHHFLSSFLFSSDIKFNFLLHHPLFFSPEISFHFISLSVCLSMSSRVIDVISSSPHLFSSWSHSTFHLNQRNLSRDFLQIKSKNTQNRTQHENCDRNQEGSFAKNVLLDLCSVVHLSF